MLEQLTNLKAIMHSKRANIYYLEKCRVMQKDGRVLYLTETKEVNQFWNIPIANTTVILLGTGTSITQAAVRMLASAGVLIGFSGDSGTPLLMGTEIEWLTPQSEYRPTEYIQGWLSFWFDEKKRLQAAKLFQHIRLDFLKATWEKDKDLRSEGFNVEGEDLAKSLTAFTAKINLASNVNELLLAEALFTKNLYRYSVVRTKHKEFSRDVDSIDKANIFLNHGNYLTYGLAATTLWVLGIPHGFAIMHGKTRRGALVFDVADLIKDAIILPWAFISSKENSSEKEFRQQVLQKFTEHKVLDFMFEQVKEQSLRGSCL